MKKIALSWILCGFAVVALMLWTTRTPMPQPGEGVSSGEALIKADFTLTGAGNKPVKATDFKGRYMLVYFGFTNCPSICPTAMLLISNVLGQLGDKAAKIQPIFVTVDPERDTPDVTAEYAAHYGKQFIGLSGTPEQIKQVTDHFKAYYSKQDAQKPGTEYQMDHSSFIYLMGPEGEYVAHFSDATPEQELRDGLAGYIR